MKISDLLPKDVNAKTGSTFFVVSDSADIQGALRFWMDAESMGKFSLMFRYRLTPKIEVLNLPHYLSVKWPQVQYSGASASHVSVAGASYFTGAKDAAGVLALMEENHVADRTRELIEGMFPGLPVTLNAVDFKQFFREQVEAAIATMPKAPKKTAVILSFGAALSHLEGGEVVAQGPADAGVPPTPTPK